MHGKVSQCTGFTFTTVIFIMVFRSLCSLYSTAYKMPLLSVHNILGRAGGVCAVLFTTTILRFYSAIKLLTSLFSLPLSFLRAPVRLPAIQQHARACVCAWAFVKISLRKGQKITLGRVDRHCMHDHGTCSSHPCTRAVWFQEKETQLQQAGVRDPQWVLLLTPI
jgi:hypothetical protein